MKYMMLSKREGVYMPPKSQIIWDYDCQNVQIQFGLQVSYINFNLEIMTTQMLKLIWKPSKVFLAASIAEGVRGS
jgi:hypothetical protein